jgi:hypothetical protein
MHDVPAELPRAKPSEVKEYSSRAFSGTATFTGGNLSFVLPEPGDLLLLPLLRGEVRIESRTGDFKIEVVNTSPMKLRQGIVASARNRLQHLIKVLKEEMEEGEVLPTDAAETAFIATMSSLVEWGAISSVSQLPHVSTMGAGDLACEWRGADRSLRLTIGPTGQLRVYKATFQGGRLAGHTPSDKVGTKDLRIAVEWVRSNQA